jgi:hypothetical protein
MNLDNVSYTRNITPPKLIKWFTVAAAEHNDYIFDRFLHRIMQNTESITLKETQDTTPSSYSHSDGCGPVLSFSRYKTVKRVPI